MAQKSVLRLSGHAVEIIGWVSSVSRHRVDNIDNNKWAVYILTGPTGLHHISFSFSMTVILFDDIENVSTGTHRNDVEW